MGRISSILTLWLLALCVSGCGGGDSFRITGEIKDFGTQNLNVVYYGDGSVHYTRTAAVDGKFMFDGSSRDWTVVYLFTNTRAPLGMAIVKNGENVEARLELHNPGATRLDGSKPSELLAGWIVANAAILNADDKKAVNDAVAAFVEKNRDNIASTVVLMNYFDAGAQPARADSLFQLIEPKMRPSYMADGWVERVYVLNGSANYVVPAEMSFIDLDDYSEPIDGRRGYLLLYSPDVSGRNAATDTLLERRLVADALDSLNVRFYEIDRGVADTLAWKKAVRSDSIGWKRLWHPFNWHQLPWGAGETLIVADSTGRILYNGPDISAGLKLVEL